MSTINGVTLLAPEPFKAAGDIDIAGIFKK
jgi:hypothetical protein